MTFLEEEIGKISHQNALNLFTLIMANVAWQHVKYFKTSLWIHFVLTSAIFHAIFHFLLTSAIKFSLRRECHSNSLQRPELSNCITASRPVEHTMLKTTTTPKILKEPKRRNTVMKRAESPTPKPKGKKSDTRKATKEPDRKILIAVDL